MIFSSLGFLLLFLPFSVLGYYALLRYDKIHIAILFIFLTSLFYYGYWDPKNLWIILFSIVANYFFGQWISSAQKWRKHLFILSLICNLGLLFYFKYTDFAIQTLNTVANTSISLIHIVLPIGISFFTFQQIAYISDIYTKKHDPTAEGFLNYCCFVCFFPQLVAGPIVHHKEMMPQFADTSKQSVNWKNMYTGLYFLSIGLAKKVLIADTLAPMVGYAFDTADNLTFCEALFAALGYTIQLYMDFSGYADMAIGCALFFNIQLPYNFNSPYKSTSIQDFWRRWHMTLSRWLRDYLYIPLGGNRKGEGRTLCNLFLTFLIGGLWHGAGWNFVFWGSLHGGALVLHRLWSNLWHKKMPALLGWATTFLFVIFAWIPFRAINFERVRVFMDALMGENGFIMRREFRRAVSATYNYQSSRLYVPMVIALALGLCISLFLKNSQDMVQYLEKKWLYYGIIMLITLSVAVLLSPSYHSEFIYFQF